MYHKFDDTIWTINASYGGDWRVLFETNVYNEAQAQWLMLDKLFNFAKKYSTINLQPKDKGCNHNLPIEIEAIQVTSKYDNSLCEFYTEKTVLYTMSTQEQ